MSNAHSDNATPMTAPLDVADDAAVRRFFWLKRLAVLAVVGGVGLIASWFVWRAHEERLLAAEERRWRDAGLILRLVELQPPAVPDEKNGALAMLRAADACVDGNSADDPFSQDPSIDFENAESWPPHAVRFVTGAVALNARALKLLHEAAAMDAARWPERESADYQSGWSPYWRNLNWLLILKSYHARLAALRGDTVTFLEDVTELHAARRLLLFNPAFQGREFAWQAGEWASKLILQPHPAVSYAGAEVRRKAQALMVEFGREPGPVADLTVPVEREVAAIIERVRAPEPWGVPAPPGSVETWVWLICRPAAVRQAQMPLEAMRRDLETIHSKPFKTIGKLWSGSPPARLWRGIEPAEGMLRELIPRPRGAGAFFKLSYEVADHKRRAVVVLACELYAADHGGEMPKDLGRLVPGYLSEIPGDAYVDKPRPPGGR